VSFAKNLMGVELLVAERDAGRILSGLSHLLAVNLFPTVA
jgi:hypothetical protein